MAMTTDESGAMLDEQALAQLSREHRLMAEIGEVIGQSLDVNEVYEGFAELVRTLIPFDRLAISILNLDEGTIRNAYVVGESIPGRGTGDVLPMGDHIKTMIETRTGFLSNLSGQEIRSFGQGYPSLLFVPLVANNEVVATLGFRSYTPNAYSDRDVSLALRVATQIGGAIRSSQLYDESRRVQQELARSNEDLQQFAYVASHDLQEPLRMVTSYVELLGRRYRGRLDDDADDFIGFVVDGAKRMQVLIDDLLAYSRVGTHAGPPELTSCQDAFDGATSNLEIAIKESGASVTHTDLPTIMGERSQLTQLFQNLIGNAIKFRGEDPPLVHIQADQKGEEWELAVSDNGIGVDPKHAERIFMIFQRLHSRAEYSGTGIGLAVCKRVVQRHGGRIWLEPNSPPGSRFVFTLPAA